MPRKPVNSNESVQYNVNYKYKSSTNKPQFVEPAKKGINSFNSNIFFTKTSFVYNKGTASPSSRQYSSNSRSQGVKRGANECWGTCTTVVKQQYTQSK